MNKLQRMYYTLEAVGWDNVPRRVWQMLKGKLGWQHRRLPAGELRPEAWEQVFRPDYQPAQAAERWRRRAASLPGGGWRADLAAALRRCVGPAAWDENVTHVVRELSAGRMIYFSRHFPTVGRPPDFQRNPIDGVSWPTGRHWSTYDQFNPQLRDMKLVWEASRFSWAFYLARAHLRPADGASDNAAARGHAPDPAALFWNLLGEWDQQNPYGLTVNWACGQEVSFRTFAWLFAAAATLEHPAATPERLHRLTQLVWYAGRHVDANINYARSQKNNHAVSEAAALWTIGRLFPEFAAGQRWAEKGKRILDAELQRQIYADGSYVQHSHNYHRVMLDDVLWAGALSRALDEPLSPRALAAVERALDWLLQMIDPHTGRVPNYGANDGALVLPLSTCAYLDYRPTAQAVHYLLRNTRCFEPGPWDESAVWLFGPHALDAPLAPPAARRPVALSDGGYYILAGPRSWGMVRCARYRDRPAQADQLHFDLWAVGVNVLRDAGSYHYFCEPPWQHHFHSTAAHNTVEVDGQDQMQKGPRFMWLRRAQGRLERFGPPDPAARVGWFRGAHDGYTRLPGRVVHQRTIVRLDDAYVVIDELEGTGRHQFALRWRLCEGDWRLGADGACQAVIPAPDGPLDAVVQVLAPPGFSLELLRGVQEPAPEGWESLHYAERTPIPVLKAAGVADVPVRFVTLIAPLGRDLRIAAVEGGARPRVCVRGFGQAAAEELQAACGLLGVDWVSVSDE